MFQCVSVDVWEFQTPLLPQFFFIWTYTYTLQYMLSNPLTNFFRGRRITSLCPPPPQGLVLISVCPPPCASFTQPSAPNSSGCNYWRPPWQKYCLDKEQVNTNNPGRQPVLWLSRIRPTDLSSSAVCPLCNPSPLPALSWTVEIMFF